MGVDVSARQASATTLLSTVIEKFETEFAPHHYRVREDGKEAWRFQCQHLRRLLGKYSLAALTPQAVADYRDARLKEKRHGKLIGPATTRKELFLLSKILDVSRKEFGYALPNGNPVAAVRKPKESKARERRLNNDEWEALAEQLQKSRNRMLWPAFVLAVETANRQAEILNLMWEHVDLKNQVALLHDPEKIKSGETRAIPLSSRAVEALERLRRFQAIPDKPKGLVVPVRRMTLYSAFKAACQRADIKNLTWHDGRHEALSRLSELGLSIPELASISGHKTWKTLSKYVHLKQTAALAKKLG